MTPTHIVHQVLVRGFMEKLAELHWTSESAAQRHAKKHAASMYLSPEQYLAAASKMWLGREKLQQLQDKQHAGAQVYWDSASGQKLVTTPEGRIITFYNAGDAP